MIAARQAGLLATGGGHAMAAGFSLPAAGLAAFHAFLDERLAQAADLPSAADLMVEGTLTVPGATTELAAQVARLAPFGAGNEEPVLVLHARPAWCAPTGWAGKAPPSAPSSKAKAAARG